MRTLMTLLALSLALAGCGEDKPPVNRLALPAAITVASPPGGVDLSPFKKVYVDAKKGVALFFIGDAGSMQVGFVDKDGVADASRLLSREETEKRKEDDPARQASIAGNNVLTATGLPDRSFQILPAQGGYLLQYQYGTLHFVSYLAPVGDRLKLGLPVDMTLLARLAAGADMGGSFRSVPTFGGIAGDKPGRLVFFTSVKPELGPLIADNAGALFHPVIAGESDWVATDLPVPTSMSDKAALDAIRSRVARDASESSAPPPVADIEPEAPEGADNMVDSDDMMVNAAL
ncbi:MAG: hypothetical protein ACOY45_12805 [Pseudomonadota bacterium]